MEEIWKDIKGYEGLYQVSNFGRVKSLPKLKKTPTTTFIAKERILIPHLCKGYLRLGLCKDGRSTQYFVHCLVAQSFIGESNGLTVNHKDENKLNNSVTNLEYMSLSDNIRYGSGIKRSSLSRIDNPLICTPVNQYSLDGKFLKRYDSIKQAKIINGFKKENITLCCQHKRNQSNGFIWRYDGDIDVEYKKKTSCKPVTVFNVSGEFIGEFDSAVDASLFTGVSRPYICECCKGRIKSKKGYIFHYKKTDNE